MKTIFQYIENVLAFCYSNFQIETWEIQLIWICIPLFVLLILFFLGVLYGIRFSHLLIEYRNKKWYPILQHLVLEYLTIDKSKIEKVQEIKHNLLENTKRKFQKEISIKILMSLANNISGEMKTAVETLFVELDLNFYTVNKIKSSSIVKKVSGLRVITQMNYKTHVDKEIIPFMNDKNQILRGEIQLALVKLYAGKGLFYLNNLAYDLSEWHQIEILEALTSHKNIKIPDLHPWLSSRNSSVISIALKVIEIYSQIQYSNEIIRLLKHKDFIIRRKARRLVRIYKMIESTDLLIQLFKEETEEDELLDLIETLEYLGIEYNYLDLDNNEIKNIVLLVERKKKTVFIA